MKTLTAAFAVSSFIAAVAGSAAMPTVASAQPVGRTYVACNQYGDCWRVHERYAYGPAAPIIYYNSDWYDAHRRDEHVHWLADPDNDRGYYDRNEACRFGHPRRRARRGPHPSGPLCAVLGSSRAQHGLDKQVKRHHRPKDRAPAMRH